MSEGNGHLTTNSVGIADKTIEEARNYERKRFTRWRRTRKLDRFEKTFAQRLFDMVGSGSHIVDIPCGNGRFYHIFSNAKKLSMGDYSTNMLKATEERFGTSENVKLLQADISAIPLNDNSADLCFLYALIPSDEK